MEEENRPQQRRFPFGFIAGALIGILIYGIIPKRNVISNLEGNRNDK